MHDLFKMPTFSEYSKEQSKTGTGPLQQVFDAKIILLYLQNSFLAGGKAKNNIIAKCNIRKFKKVCSEIRAGKILLQLQLAEALLILLHAGFSRRGFLAGQF